MLKINNLYAYYGEVEALKGVSLSVDEGAITCLIGSNGAGKTSLLRAISGAIKATGEIIFGKNNIVGTSPVKVAKHGIIHVPEGRHIFPGLTVEENLETGTINWHGFFGRKPFDEDLAKVYDLFPRLEERKKQLGWSLSGGEQQMLAIGRGIMARPKILLLDEPSMGLAPLVIESLFENIIKISKLGIPILLVEQNAKLALQVSKNAFVIDGGKVILKGEAKTLRNDPRVIEAYLGKIATAQKPVV